MKIIEESKLKACITELNLFEKKHQAPIAFFDALDEVNLPSFQSVSVMSNFAFFDEVSFILSVISTIIAHPHLSNKGEDIVIRSDLAGHISSESFQRVFKEPSLWKEKEHEMVPEYVHHYQYTDDLKIYENLFIGLVIKMIDIELGKYNTFYTDLIPTVSTAVNDTYLEAATTLEAFKKMSILNRKLRYIKNSHFYHEISKVKFTPRNIEPTNILVKDRLYNYCFKFYKKFIQYIDTEKLYEDFRKYYWYKILKVLKQKEFKLLKSPSTSSLTFMKEDYIINLKLEENKPTILFKISLKEKEIFACHRLMFNVEKVENNALTEDEKAKTKELLTDALTLNEVSIYHLKDMNTGFSFSNNPLTEEEIAEFFINDKIQEQNMAEEIYSTYCPCCKSKNLVEVKDVYTCGDCGAKYTFKKKDKAWFLRIGRINNGRK